jgi:peptidoglycan/LPS O-acetylase OafA/YrhL
MTNNDYLDLIPNPILAFAATIIAGTISWYWIEKPILAARSATSARAPGEKLGPAGTRQLTSSPAES